MLKIHRTPRIESLCFVRKIVIQFVELRALLWWESCPVISENKSDKLCEVNLEFFSDKDNLFDSNFVRSFFLCVTRKYFFCFVNIDQTICRSKKKPFFGLLKFCSRNQRSVDIYFVANSYFSLVCMHKMQIFRDSFFFG